MSTLSPTEGKLDFIHEGETFQTYYKVYGDILNNSRRPLIILHGGPGLTHDYLLPHVDLTSKYNIPIILYDQIGNGKSTHLKDKESGFLTVELFVAELENLINHFGIREGFDILGHSWGGILASEFAIRNQPPGLKHLVFANSLPDYNLWKESTIQLLQTLPEDVLQGVAGGMKDKDVFWDALKKFHAVYGCTVKPFPQDYEYTMEQVFGPDGDTTVAASPLIDNWPGAIDRLHLIKASTFVINGRMDIAQDFVVKPFFDKIQRVKWVTLENSSHTPFFEERDRYMELVSDFINL